MNNSEILRSVTNYIDTMMQEKGISADDLEEMCSTRAEKERNQKLKISSSTIRNMFKKPSSTTLSTLIKICDTLELNLSTIFHMMEHTNMGKKESRLIYDINNPAFRGYCGTYTIWFLSTSLDKHKLDQQKKDPLTTLFQGKLELKEIEHSGEVNADLSIDTKEYTEEGEKYIKHFTGRLAYSTAAIMFLNLTSPELGDEWHLVWNADQLNNQQLLCVTGCAVTSSSGRTKNPAVHRICLTNDNEFPNISPASQRKIAGLLKVQNDVLFIEKKTLDSFLADEASTSRLGKGFKDDLKHHIERTAVYYRIRKNKLRDDSDIEYANGITELCLISGQENVYQVQYDEDDTTLLSILRTERENKS